MSLILYGHPFSSYTQKVLVALYENAMPFDFRRLAPDLPGHLQQWLERWPLRKFPLLVDGERNVAETSIIIEYLQLAHPGPLRLLPDDAMQALDVRFLDRYFDLHVMTPVQHAVGAALSGDAAKTEEGRGRPRVCRRQAEPRLRLAGHPPGRQDVGRRRPLDAGRLRRRSLAVLCGLDAADSRSAAPAARLPRAPAGPPVIRPRGGRSTPVPPPLPPGRAAARLNLFRQTRGGKNCARS